MALDQNTLKAILAGRLTLDDVMNQDQQQQDPRQNYLGSFGQDYSQQAMQLGDQMGLYNQKPQYQFDDAWKVENDLYDRGIAEAKAGYTTALDQEKLGLSQEKNAREQEAMGYKYSSPDADFLAATMKGLKPEQIQQALSGGSKDDVDFLMETIGMVDANGAAEYTPANIQRLAHLEQYHETLQAQQAQDMDKASSKARWQGLNPEARAKETYLRLQNPDQKIAVGRDGTAYFGADAETQAAKAKASASIFPFSDPYKGKATGKPAPGPKRTLGRDVGNFTRDLQKGTGMVGTVNKWTPGGIVNQGVNAAFDKGPQAARSAWHYAFG